MFLYGCKDIYSINCCHPFSWISDCQNVLSALSFIETLSLCSVLTTSSAIIVPPGSSDKDSSQKEKKSEGTSWQMKRNWAKLELWRGCAQCLLKANSESYIWKVFRQLQRIGGNATTWWTCVSLVILEYVCWSRRSAAKYWTLVSNQIMFRDATWLNCNLTLSVYVSQGPETDPLQLRDWQHRDWKPFFSVVSIWVWKDFTLLKFTKSVAVCIMHGSFSFFLSSVVGLQ